MPSTTVWPAERVGKRRENSRDPFSKTAMSRKNTGRPIVNRKPELRLQDQAELRHLWGTKKQAASSSAQPLWPRHPPTHWTPRCASLWLLARPVQMESPGQEGPTGSVQVPCPATPRMSGGELLAPSPSTELRIAAVSHTMGDSPNQEAGLKARVPKQKHQGPPWLIRGRGRQGRRGAEAGDRC